MDDVNLLPDDLRKEEEREHKRKGDRTVGIPMSTPIVDAEKANRPVSVSQSRGADANVDPKLKHVREESYIGINAQGKIVHETPAESSPASSRARLPWWQRLFLRAEVTQKRRVNQQESASAPTPHTSPTPSRSAPPPPSAPVLARKESAPLLDTPHVASPEHTPVSVPKAVSPATTIKTVSQAGKVNEPSRERDPLAPPPLGVNLIPSEWVTTPQRESPERVRTLIIVATACLVVSILSILGRYVFIGQQTTERQRLNDRHQELLAQIAEYGPREQQWNQLQRRLTALSNLLDRHINVLPAFALLEETVLPQVMYKSVALVTDGTMMVSGQATTFELVAKQMVALQQSEAKPTVTLANYSLDKETGRIVFQLTVQFPTQLLYAAAE